MKLELEEIARITLEPFTNNNNPNNEGMCNACKKGLALICSDCKRLDVQMCKMCHLTHFGTSKPTIAN